MKFSTLGLSTLAALTVFFGTEAGATCERPRRRNPERLRATAGFGRSRTRVLVSRNQKHSSWQQIPRLRCMRGKILPGESRSRGERLPVAQLQMPLGAEKPKRAPREKLARALAFCSRNPPRRISSFTPIPR